MPVTGMTGDHAVPFLPWPDFLAEFRWEQGEHMGLIASTQSGKTTMIRALQHYRRYCVFLATKNKDSVIDGFRADGYRTQKKWEPIPAAWPKIMLKPGLKGTDDMWRQREAFKFCLDDVFQTGGWTVICDEVRYITQNLNLHRELELLWLQAASADATVVGATQRPAWVPGEFYNASTHIFLWSESDARNLKRLSELDGANTDLIKWTIQRLGEYEALYVCTRKGSGLQMARTKAPKGT
jgi:hypothetical protein